MNAFRFLLTLMMGVLFTSAALANQCAAPFRDGSPSALSGVVNTYFPGTATAFAGSTTITLGAGMGAGTGIAAGDLLLVIQVQNAQFNTTNDSRYGDGVLGGTASGYTDPNRTGAYEYVRATNNVPLTGGVLTIAGGDGGGLDGTYRHRAASAGNLKASFQVVRVPQYGNATVTGAITALPWNGSAGGIVAMDVAGRLMFAGGSVNVSGQGFRGGGGRQQGGVAGTTASPNDVRTPAAQAYNGAKGEGIAGTGRYVFDGIAMVDTGVEGYPNGSNARGAPGNAGGGGSDGNPAANDENSGGGGGGNGGAGGGGGYGWCPGAPFGCNQSGGFGGGAFAERSVIRAVLGGGGGAGTSNNNTGTGGAIASSGARGGGLVMIRAGEIAGAGTVLANGASANNSVDNDGSGGGGAGGSVLVSSVRTVAGASLSISARGGNGGSNTGGGAAHGTGGGGGGGFVATTASVPAFTDVAGGTAGTTANTGTIGPNYGAEGGDGGDGIAIAGADIPGLSSGGECTPTIRKAFATQPVAPGMTSRLDIIITNNNPTLALSGLGFVDTYPNGLTNSATPSPGNSCTTAATLAGAAGGSSFTVSNATLSAGATCTYSVNTRPNSAGDKVNTIPAGAVTGNYAGRPVANLDPATATLSVAPPLTVLKSSQAFFDPQNGTTNAKLIPGGAVAYTITVTNPASFAVDAGTLAVIDATPANLRLFVRDVAGAGSGPLVFNPGTPASGLSYSWGGYASTTDSLDFSNNGGTSWTYVPVPGADGTDPAITHIRLRPAGAMAAGSSFTVQFGYLIN